MATVMVGNIPYSGDDAKVILELLRRIVAMEDKIKRLETMVR